MKNLKHKSQDGRGVVLALTVPAGTIAGRPLALGNGGLIGVPVTERATPTLRAEGRAPQGLKDNEASVCLPGIGMTLDLGARPGGAVDFGKAYIDANGTLAAAPGAGFTDIGFYLPGGLVGIRCN